MNIKHTIHQFLAKDKQLANSQPLFLHMSEQEVRRRLTILEERHRAAIQVIINILLELDKHKEPKHDNET